MIANWMRTAMLSVAVLSGAAAASEPGDPAELIRDTAGQIFSRIDEQREAIRNDPAIAEQIVRDYLLPKMDIVYSARLILGRESRRASPEQLEAFAEAMNSQLISRYSAGLLEFKDSEQVEVLDFKGEINPRATKVKTRFRLESGGYALVDYVLRMTDEGWKVFDVVVEGISYIVSFQGQIKPEVRANGLDAVIERLTNGELDLTAG